MADQSQTTARCGHESGSECICDQRAGCRLFRAHPTTPGHRINPSVGWLSLMAEVKAIRGGLSFSKRMKFDDALRPPIEGRPGAVIAYPDAIYHITEDDLKRAKEATDDAR